MAHRKETTVFYESPHRILDSLHLLAELLPDRQIVLARELTKIHEEFLRGNAAELAAMLELQERVRGEFVLLLDGTTCEDAADLTAARRVLAELQVEGLTNRTILRILVQGLGISRNEAYRLVHQDPGN
jgi:16S rRNA (cytidine1402-2'-O)-methyltransferase